MIHDTKIFIFYNRSQRITVSFGYDFIVSTLGNMSIFLGEAATIWEDGDGSVTYGVFLFTPDDNDPTKGEWQEISVKGNALKPREQFRNSRPILSGSNKLKEGS
jgi:hypothetical protein